MSDDKAVSPTGASWLPQWAVKVGAAVLTTLGSVAALPMAGINIVPVQVSTVCLALVIVFGPLFGVASQGLRKT